MTKPVAIGAPVKVHVSRNTSLFGEVVGVSEEGKLLVCARKDFATYPLSAFRHFRQFDEVVFLTDKPQYQFEQPPPRKPKEPKSIRLKKALLDAHRKQIVERAPFMDDVECNQRIKAIETLKQKIDGSNLQTQRD